MQPKKRELCQEIAEDNYGKRRLINTEKTSDWSLVVGPEVEAEAEMIVVS